MAEEDRLVADTPKGAVLGSVWGHHRGRGVGMNLIPYPNPPPSPELLLGSLVEQLLEGFGVALLDPWRLRISAFLC